MICKDKQECGAEAAKFGAERIRQAIAEKGECRIILATGASQFEMQEALLKEEGIDWTKVTMFHLDEYVGLPVTHPASFRKYLTERFVEKHVRIGIDAMRMIIDEKRTVKHLKYEW